MNQRMQLSDWIVDNSAGRPILTYKGCSVIEAEDAEFVLGAIKAALSAVEPARCRDCDGYNCDNGCAYPGSRPAPSVAVKALEWQDVEWYDEPNKGPGAKAHEPHSAWYFVNPHNGGWRINFGTQEIHPTIEAAKAAAQADYEARIRSALSVPAQDVVGLSQWEGWDKSRGFWSETKHRDAVMFAMFRGPWSMEDAAMLLGFIDTTWPKLPAKQQGCRHDLGKLEFHLKSLVSAYPEKARLASSREDLRMFFVAELTKVASGRIPLLEIEGLVSRHLAAAGGEA